MAWAPRDGGRRKQNKHTCSRTEPDHSCRRNLLQQHEKPARKCRRLEAMSSMKQSVANPGSSFGRAQNMGGSPHRPNEDRGDNTPVSAQPKQTSNVRSLTMTSSRYLGYDAGSLAPLFYVAFPPRLQPTSTIDVRGCEPGMHSRRSPAIQGAQFFYQARRADRTSRREW